MFLPETNDREINLSDKNLTDKNLTDHLSGYQNQTVISLNLSFNKLTLLDCDAFREFITQQSLSLKKLILHGNELNDRSVEILVSVINQSQIEELHLGLNKISDEGIKTLCKALKENSYLKTLSLSHNAIGREAIFAIIDMLRVNRILEYLSLECCQLNKIENILQLMDKLLEAAYTNPKLIGIEIHANHLSPGYFGKFTVFFKSRRPDIFPTMTSNTPPHHGCIIM